MKCMWQWRFLYTVLCIWTCNRPILFSNNPWHSGPLPMCPACYGVCVWERERARARASESANDPPVGFLASCGFPQTDTNWAQRILDSGNFGEGKGNRILACIVAAKILFLLSSVWSTFHPKPLPCHWPTCPSKVLESCCCMCRASIYLCRWHIFCANVSGFMVSLQIRHCEATRDWAISYFKMLFWHVKPSFSVWMFVAHCKQDLSGVGDIKFFTLFPHATLSFYLWF